MAEKELSDILDSETGKVIWRYGPHQKQTLHQVLSDNKSNIFLNAIDKYYLKVGISELMRNKQILMTLGEKYGVNSSQTLMKIYLLLGREASEFNDYARRVILYHKIQKILWYILIVWFILSDIFLVMGFWR